MSEIPGLLLLLGVSLVLLVLLLGAMLARAARRPPRHTIGYALGRGLPVDPADLGLEHEAWELDRPGDVRLPVWEIPTGGPGPTAVMIHGWGQSRVDMLARIEPWRSLCRRIVLFDMRGHGDATGPSRLGDAEAGDLRALLEHLGEGPFILVGHSMGAGVAIAAAADAGRDDVVGVVAIGAFAAFHRALQARVRQVGLPPRPITDLAMTWFRLRGLRFAPVAHAAARLACPLLVLHGAGDPVCPPGEARRIAEAARGGRLVVFDDAGHLDAHEVAEAAHRRAIEAFLADLGIA